MGFLIHEAALIFLFKAKRTQTSTLFFSNWKELFFWSQQSVLSCSLSVNQTRGLRGCLRCCVWERSLGATLFDFHVASAGNILDIACNVLHKNCVWPQTVCLMNHLSSGRWHFEALQGTSGESPCLAVRDRHVETLHKRSYRVLMWNSPYYWSNKVVIT